MNKIYHEGQCYLIIDKTDAHYICVKDEGNDGYYLLSKKTAAEKCYL